MDLSQNLTVDFAPIIDWYQSHCDGDWEHQFGIQLDTLDNPGWMLTIDLMGTNLEGRPMKELNEGCDEDSHPVLPKWIHCFISKNQFRGACDPTQVSRLFSEFQKFAAVNP